MTVVAGLDIETTGLEIGDHRIIEVCLELWKDAKRIFRWEQRIDPQRSIAVDAQRVHGISATDLIGKPIWPTVAPILQTAMSKASIYVAHNAVEFDLKFIEFEMRRIGLAMPKRQVIDTLDCTWATPDGKKPSLKEFCFACGVEYDVAKAHAASYDVEVMMESFHKAQAWGFIALPEELKKAS